MCCMGMKYVVKLCCVNLCDIVKVPYCILYCAYLYGAHNGIWNLLRGVPKLALYLLESSRVFFSGS